MKRIRSILEKIHFWYLYSFPFVSRERFDTEIAARESQRKSQEKQHAEDLEKERKQAEMIVAKFSEMRSWFDNHHQNIYFQVSISQEFMLGRYEPEGWRRTVAGYLARMIEREVMTAHFLEKTEKYTLDRQYPKYPQNLSPYYRESGKPEFPSR